MYSMSVGSGKAYDVFFIYFFCTHQCVEGIYIYSREVSKATLKKNSTYLHPYCFNEKKKSHLLCFLQKFYPNSNVPKAFIERNDLSCMRINDMRRECEIPIGMVRWSQLCSNKDILRKKIHFILFFCFRGSYYFTRVFISEPSNYV